MQNQESTLTLDHVINQMNAWRTQKKRRSEPMPEFLKILIARLAPLYKAYTIASTLRISLSALRHFQNTYASENVINQKDANIAQVDRSLNKISDEQKINFIPFQVVPLATVDNTAASNSNNSTINTDSNASTTCQIIKPNGIKLVIATNDPTTIIKSFLCYN